jgi:hypothetical protein
MYSWAGEDRFNDSELFEMIREGAVSTGSFSSMLASIFGGQAAMFSYNGDTTFGGRRVLEFGFRVPLEKSAYSYVLGDKGARQVTIEYSGTFLADPDSSDLVRMTVRASHLPVESSTCEITQTLKYSRVSLHDADFLLPDEVRISAVHTDGSEAENVIHYSACHEFRGESSVHFESAPKAGVPDSQQESSPTSLSLPTGLPFKVMFTQSIDTAGAAAGDLIRGKLKTVIRDRSSKVLVPEGASITGRIIRITHFHAPVRPEASRPRDGHAQRPSLIIKVRLEGVEIGGRPYPLPARFDSDIKRFPKAARVLTPRVEIGSLNRLDDSNDGAFEFFGATDQVIPNGLESSWLTLGP